MSNEVHKKSTQTARDRHDGKLFTLAWGKQEERMLKDGRLCIIDVGYFTHYFSKGKRVPLDTNKYVMASIDGAKLAPLNKSKLAPKPKPKSLGKQFVKQGKPA